MAEPIPDELRYVEQGADYFVTMRLSLAAWSKLNEAFGPQLGWALSALGVETWVEGQDG